MMLYVLAIEELLLKIKKNNNINGYVVSNDRVTEIKVTAYADDVCGYTVDESSTKEFFNEFDRWGEISGASLNKDKTQYIKVNGEDGEDVKVLGIWFNNNGISNNNLENIFNKIKQSIFLWNVCDLNMLERITVCKTFILSKLWFLACFVKFEDNFIKEINTLIFNYIWENRKECIKRDTLILPCERGGLGMFNIFAKLKTISFQQFKYIYVNFERDFYCMSVFWLKFQFRNKLKNFNNVVGGEDKERPSVYKFMIENLDEFKMYDKECMNNLIKYNSKKTYEKFRVKYEKKPNCEMNDNNSLDWKNIYKNTNNKKLNSELRVNNYKIINYGLGLDIKLKSMCKNCYFCEKVNESVEHLFVECEKTKRLFEENKVSFFKNRITSYERNSVLYHINLEHETSKLMSIFKLSVWRLRNLIKNNPTVNIFKNMLYANKIKYYK